MKNVKGAIVCVKQQGEKGERIMEEDWSGEVQHTINAKKLSKNGS